jgi:hypothetical protein
VVAGLASLAAVLAACFGQETAPASRSPSTPSLTPPATDAAADPETASFATGVSDDGRFFVDQRGEPWFGLGDTAWSLFGQLDRSEVDLYLDDRAARGFNLVLASVIENHYSDDPPNNAAGDPPFVGEIFQSEPNEAYWQWVDYVVQAAQARGITLLLVPAYLGSDAGDGLQDEVAAATGEQLAEYGQFLADRYDGFPNLMWLIGHDQVPAATVKSREEALAARLPSDDLVGLGAGLGLQTPQWQPTSIDADFEGVYSYDAQPVAEVGAGWAATPTRPVVYLEGRYEQEGDAGPGSALLRLQSYGAFGGGAAAVLFGNNPIWHFESVALYEFAGSWQDNLASLGSQDTERFGTLVRSLRWWEMSPDVDGRIVPAGEGAGSEQAAARFSQTQAFVYVPTRRPTTLDLSLLGQAQRLVVTRVDPRSGESVLGEYSRTERVPLPDPGPNAAGDDDWLYVVTPSPS